MSISTIRALVVAACLAAAMPAAALEAMVTQVDKNADGTFTYHFTIKVDAGETLTPSEPVDAGDFVTLYNFYGLVDGSPKAPAGWVFSSEQSGRTPSLDGYPLVLPVDVPNTPNLTWTVTKAVPGGSQIDGFTAVTRVGAMVQGEYSAQVSRQIPAVAGAGAAQGFPAQAVKQATIGLLPMPSFLAETK